MRPLDRFDAALLGGLVAVGGIIVATPVTRRFYALDLLPIKDAFAAGVVTATSVVVLQAFLRGRRPHPSED